MGDIEKKLNEINRGKREEGAGGKKRVAGERHVAEREREKDRAQTEMRQQHKAMLVCA